MKLKFAVIINGYNSDILTKFQCRTYHGSEVIEKSGKTDLKV